MKTYYLIYANGFWVTSITDKGIALRIAQKLKEMGKSNVHIKVSNLPNVIINI